MSNTDNGLQASLYFYFYLLSTADSIIEPTPPPPYPGIGKPTLRDFYHKNAPRKWKAYITSFLKFILKASGYRKAYIARFGIDFR